MAARALRCGAIGAVLAAVVLLPFLSKAFTIDDPLFLRQAEHVKVDPLHPSAFSMVWSEWPAPRRLTDIMPSGPLMAYLLVPSIALGGAEWAAHAVELGMLIVAVIFTASLALRIGMPPRDATVASLLVAATPGALAMAGTAMPDVPAMALGVLGMERLLAWKQDRRAHQAIAATVAFALAVLARSHLLLLLPVGAVALGRPRGDGKRFTPLLIAPLLALLVLFVTRDPQPGTRGLSGAAMFFSSFDNVPRNLVSFCIHWVLVIPLGVPLLLLRTRSVLSRVALYVGTAAAFLVMRSDSAPPAFYVVSIVAGIGAAVMWDLCADAINSRDTNRLLLVAWLLVPLPVVFYVQYPSKYLLAAAPAAALIVARELAAAPVQRARAVFAGTLAAGVVVGVLVLRADAAFAGFGKRAAEELIAKNVASGRRVWFDGHWGFQWYAERAGGMPVTITEPFPQAGDLIVSCPQSLGYMLKRLTQPHRLVDRMEDKTPGGRILNRSAYAGFYTNRLGNLPWSWSAEPLARCDLVEVTP
jgi:hypothetical protein